MLVRDCILRDLADEPDPVVRVDATARLGTDIKEYVLTDHLAADFAGVIEPVIRTVWPGQGNPTGRVGVWVSGFFGSGKSHFAKLAGHLLANTGIGDDTARHLFERVLLHPGRSGDDRLAELLHEARTSRLGCHLVAFDIQSLHVPGAEDNAGLIFLRAFHQSLGLSSRPGFAEAELDLQAEGKYDELLDLYKRRTGRDWQQDKNDALALSQFAACLAELLPSRHPDAAKAMENLNAATLDLQRMFSIDRVIDRLLRWIQVQQPSLRLVFVADEVGGWAGRNLNRIEQIRAFVETAGQVGAGRIWLLATSQERLSDVVTNATDDKSFLQRLEARFQTNVHLDSNEVGRVIEDRILSKKPTGADELRKLWLSAQPLLRDIAEPPGLDLQANYPRPEQDRFVSDYPFLPYQLQAAADLFGGMRGVKVSSGARSMIKVAFDATSDLAAEPVGALVTWDRIFDSANSDNEFADEQYLGSQGLDYLATADRDVTGLAFGAPARILKTLWLIQQGNRIPRTERNLARLLTSSTDSDVLLLEQQVAEALRALEASNFVRHEAGTEQWKFLTQDEVTVEKIVKRLAEDLGAAKVRQELTSLAAAHLGAIFTGRTTHGASATSFTYGVSLSSNPLRNDSAPVQLAACFEGSPAADAALAGVAATLDRPRINWVLPPMPRLEDRLRRALAIEALPADEEYRRIATDRTRAEADKLAVDADQLRKDAESDLDTLFQSGRLVYGGQIVDLATDPDGAKALVEKAIGDRLDVVYTRFSEGDRRFAPVNIDKLFTAAPGDRMALDPQLGIFGPDGHVNGNNVLVEELSAYLKTSIKTSGTDVIESFSRLPFGWQPDLLRYVAAAMFVDAKVSVAESGGKTFDDPRAAQARGLFGLRSFQTARLIIEEDALSPPESDAARDRLSRLGRKPDDGSESALKEAALRLCNDLTRRGALVEKAKNFGLALPATFDRLQILVDDVQNAGSRVRVVRALLASTTAIEEVDRALKQLEDFDGENGFEQFRRSRQLLQAAIEAGLKDDAELGTRISEAEEQTGLIIQGRRVLADFHGVYQKYRTDVLEAFRATYVPLRTLLHERTESATKAIRAMPEFEALSLGDRAAVRTEFLGEGRSLQEVTLPELRNEEQLLAASSQLNVGHLRLALNSLDAELSRARARVIELYSAAQTAKGEQARTATWSAVQAFAGKRFQTEDQVDAAFDAVIDHLKALIRDGKTVEVV